MQFALIKKCADLHTWRSKHKLRRNVLELEPAEILELFSVGILFYFALVNGV